MQIFEYISVHVAPPELDEPEPQTNQLDGPAPAHKHVQILFIKAPAPPKSRSLAALLQAPRSEEKTLVYVLVKKPEQIDEIAQAQAQAEQKVNKPEVYFIKYKTQKQEAPAAAPELIPQSAPIETSIQSADQPAAAVDDQLSVSASPASELPQAIAEPIQEAPQSIEQVPLPSAGSDIPSASIQQLPSPSEPISNAEEPSRKYIPSK